MRPFDVTNLFMTVLDTVTSNNAFEQAQYLELSVRSFAARNQKSKLFMTGMDTVTLNNAFEHAQYLVQYLVSCISIWYY